MIGTKGAQIKAIMEKSGVKPTFIARSGVRGRNQRGTRGEKQVSKGGGRWQAIMGMPDQPISINGTVEQAVWL